MAENAQSCTSATRIDGKVDAQRVKTDHQSMMNLLFVHLGVTGNWFPLIPRDYQVDLEVRARGQPRLSG